jgi:hypothetical protein
MSSTTTISHEKLARLIGTPACPVLLDVRTDEDFALDQRLIPGSRRRSHKNIETWRDEADGKRAIVIWGKKLSEGRQRCCVIMACPLNA